MATLSLPLWTYLIAANRQAYSSDKYDKTLVDAKLKR
jgi:hypothetical protein